MKQCRYARPHKPHLWSRTTKRTVTEETAGDTLQCPGSGQHVQETDEDPRGAQIDADARSGTNWASLVGYGSACACGAFREGETVTSQGWIIPKAWCHRHGVMQPNRITRER